MLCLQLEELVATPNVSAPNRFVAAHQQCGGVPGESFVHGNRAASEKTATLARTTRINPKHGG